VPKRLILTDVLTSRLLKSLEFYAYSYSYSYAYTYTYTAVFGLEP
jgi:hypothetical protein